MKFCSDCGGQVIFRIPPGDDRPRFICEDCRTVHYTNPKMVVGCIVEEGDRILICRRSIEPRCGKWTIPAGYLENGETVSEGAVREVFEETRAKVEITAPFALFNLTFISQLYFIFRARLLPGGFDAGEESLEVKLTGEEEIPWDDLAFEVIRRSLRLYFRDRPRRDFPFHMETLSRRGEVPFP